MEIETEGNKSDRLKLLNFCRMKETISKVKRQPSELEHITTNQTTAQELISHIYKKLMKLNTRTANNPIKKWAELNRHFSREDINMGNEHSTHYQRDESQYHNEMSSHIGHNDHHPKSQTRNTGEVVVK